MVPPRPPDPPPRRRFLRWCGVCLSGMAALIGGCASLFKPRHAVPPAAALDCPAAATDGDFDYIVVGSGAGGGPLAANLALAGFRVLLLEAGGDEEPYEYQVPAFHAQMSEDERFAWNFYVRHYGDDAQQCRDDKFQPHEDGVLYPRCATLGGCTAHNAMIVVYPHNSDWDHIAKITGDASWHSENMRRYFERLERCGHVSIDDTQSRHGFEGWLPTSVPELKLISGDPALQRLAKAAARESYKSLGGAFTRVFDRLRSRLDPNDWRLVTKSSEGICVAPLSTENGRRSGSREYVRRVQQACGDRLVILTHALATRVVLDADQRATGVEYLAGGKLYGADPRAGSSAAGEQLRATARREVILCAGAFNTPQLLKLSGVGPREELERHGIPVRVDLPGVGENLQDRYEICVVTQFKEDFPIMQGMTLRAPGPGEEPDPQFREWLQGKGPYTTNGAVVAMMKRSQPDVPEPDLFIFGLLGSFRGYYPCYAGDVAKRKDYFTWAVLKAHTSNTAGHVRLRSRDPREVPDINFHYFDEGNGGESDLDAVVEGVQTARRIIGRCDGIVAEEVHPGPAVQTPEQIRQFVKDNAWGHHASCTCKMGPESDRCAVVDSRFRVYGTRGLRVVDASVFPKIPGFFIVSSVYMISEKASEVIVEDARTDAARVRPA